MSTEDSPAVLDRIVQLLCAMQGHDEVLEFDGTRMFLRCVNCGHETPGWDVPRRQRAASRRDVTPPGADGPDTRRAA